MPGEALVGGLGNAAHHAPQPIGHGVGNDVLPGVERLALLVVDLAHLDYQGWFGGWDVDDITDAEGYGPSSLFWPVLRTDNGS